MLPLPAEREARAVENVTTLELVEELMVRLPQFFSTLEGLRGVVAGDGMRIVQFNGHMFRVCRRGSKDPIGGDPVDTEHCMACGGEWTSFSMYEKCPGRQ
jgi:hypothetical protein